MISAYARQGMIDHQLLSFDNYARLAEDLFMGGVRLDPAAMGIPDNRPVIRDGLTNAYDLSGDLIPVGDLLAEFDFSQTPLPPVVLSTHIPVDIQLTCGTQKNGPGAANNCTVNKVHVTWKPVRGFNVTDVFVYHVLRDGVALTGCVTTASSCQDVASPGVHLYTVYSVDPSGIQSPVSAAAEADVPAG